MKSTIAFAPASIGNLNAGFDSMGMAIQPIDELQPPFGDRVFISPCLARGAGNGLDLEVVGPYADQLPENQDENIVTQCVHRFHEKLAAKGQHTGPLNLILEKNLPVRSGLGSSATSIVAALAGLNHYYGDLLDQAALLSLMGEMESRISGSLHYDNVAPCFLGDIQLIVEQSLPTTQRVPSFSEWFWVLTYPGFEVSTASARDLLPDRLNRQTCLEYGRKLAGFVNACQNRDPELAARWMIDSIAEPFRRHLLPGFDKVQKMCLDLQTLAMGISGSGPTLFVVCRDLQQATIVLGEMNRIYVATDTGFSRICKTDVRGAWAKHNSSQDQGATS